MRSKTFGAEDALYRAPADPSAVLTMELIGKLLLRPNGGEGDMGRPVARQFHQLTLGRHRHDSRTPRTRSISQRFHPRRGQPAGLPFSNASLAHAEPMSHLQRPRSTPQSQDGPRTLDNCMWCARTTSKAAQLQPIIAPHGQVRFHGHTNREASPAFPARTSDLPY